MCQLVPGGSEHPRLCCCPWSLRRTGRLQGHAGTALCKAMGFIEGRAVLEVKTRRMHRNPHRREQAGAARGGSAVARPRRESELRAAGLSLALQVVAADGGTEQQAWLWTQTSLQTNPSRSTSHDCIARYSSIAKAHQNTAFPLSSRIVSCDCDNLNAHPPLSTKAHCSKIPASHLRFQIQEHHQFLHLPPCRRTKLVSSH